MSARPSAEVTRAVRLWRAGGITLSAAAILAGVHVSSLRRTLRKAGVGPLKAGRPVKEQA